MVSSVLQDDEVVVTWVGAVHDLRQVDVDRVASLHGEEEVGLV